jgi:hypothetical protein
MTQITFFQVCSVLIILSSSGYFYAFSTHLRDRIDTLVEGEEPVSEIYEGKERKPCHFSGGYLLAFRHPYPGSVTGHFR